jgi:alpha-galactosidase
VTGKPLTIGTQVYDKGIGVHARSSLTFAADKKWDTLAATIGLDAGAGGKGDCVFVVVADGQPIFSRRMRGTDPPHELQLPITGREQITLLVEPGEGLDMADHANWCDVRLLKSRK